MLFRFSCTTFLALALAARTDAFLSPSIKRTHVLSAAGGSKGEADGGDAEEDVSSGGSKFRDILRQAQQQKDSEPERPVMAIDNPFLTPPVPVQTPADPENLSIEEQARMFREMMQKQQQPEQQKGAVLPSVTRVSKTDKAGKPIGRNRDADQIANTADVYFAQLKRDSTVRTMARIQGDEETAEQVFADEGIKALEGLIQENPYLKGQREKEETFFDTVPEEMLKPFFTERKEQPLASGVSYKQKLEEKKKKRIGGASQTPAAVPQTVQETPEPVAQAQPVQEAPKPEPVVQAQPVQEAPEPAPVQPPPVPKTVVEPPAQTPISASPQTVAAPAVVAEPVSASSEESRAKIRTLMGLLLKHRGGPGFGAGRLKGPEIDKFDNLLQEVTSMLSSEAASSTPMDSVATSTPVQSEPQVVAAPASPVQSMPPAIAAPSVPSPGSFVSSLTPNPAADKSKVESAIACVEGALTMYKNSPPELQEGILITLQAALMSSVNTINSAIANNEVVNHAKYQASVRGEAASASVAPPSTAAQSQEAAPPPLSSTAASAQAIDPHSKRIEELLSKLTAAAGDGALGLRSDLSAGEANELADELVELRAMLMDELDTGIPDAEPSAAQVAEPVAAQASSTVSKYQQMLAKAKAEKANQ